MGNYYELSNKLEGVLEILEGILCEKLDNFGIYYRLFSRVKSGESIEKKLATARYRMDPEKKISDLFGLRIVLYYQDDIELCQKILDDILENVRWKESINDESSFQPSKNNGTFMLPGFVRQIVEPEIEGLRIRPTFEIQLRTVLFEGWHEAEHDMRYKEKEIWEEKRKEARKLNSILATLEMCDQYMVALFDDMGHDFYIDKDWGRMIRYRYRLRTLNGEIDPAIEALLTTELCKAVFKWDKKEFIDMVLRENINRLDANTIIYLANENLRDTPEYVEGIREAYQDIRKRAYEKKEPGERYIQRFRMNNAFDVTVVLARPEEDWDEKFRNLTEVIYEEWLKKELEELLPEEFEQGVHCLRYQMDGSYCNFEYNEVTYDLRVNLSHLGMDAPGKVWTVIIGTWVDDSGRLCLRCRNSFSVPENAPEEVMPYSRPKVYSAIVKKCRAYDVLPLTKNIQNLSELTEEQFVRLLESEERTLPVIVITAAREEDLTDSESCYGHLVDFTTSTKEVGRNNLARKIADVCHVFCATGENAERIAKLLGENPGEYTDGVRFFARGFTFSDKSGYYRSYTTRQILEKPKDLYAVRTKKPHYYQSVSGPDAVRHELIEMVYSHILAGKNTRKNW